VTPEPKAYQTTGIDFLAPRSAAILGDDAGLGKSMQLIRAADQIGAKRIIIVCPAIGMVSWRQQLAQWQTLSRQVLFATAEAPTGPCVLVVTYDWLSRKQHRIALQARLVMEPADLLVLDEAHYLKTPTARRTLAVYGQRLEGTASLDGIAGYASRVWIASATLHPNNASELYTHIKALFPDVLVELFGKQVNQYQFRDRFCHTRDTPFGVKILGNNRANVPALKAALTPHMLVRKKADVLPEIGPLQCLELPLEVGDKTALDADVIDQRLRTAAQAIGLNISDDDDDDDAFLALLANMAPEAASERQKVGLAKVAPTVAWIKDRLDNDPGKKLVVFAHHREVIGQLMAELDGYSPVKIDGGTPLADKVTAADRFQTDPDCRVLVGQIVAAGTSITLTAADEAVLIEPDWTPVTNYQAISRLHRLGQKSTVTAWFATLAGTHDQRVGRALRRKAADSAQLFGELPGGFI